MSVSVSMPQLGESVTEGTVTRWLKREGEHVQADEPLLEVSTDKVDTEIPSPVSGILRGITVAEDETVAVGAELAIIEEDGSAGAAPPAAAPQAAPQQAAPEPAPQLAASQPAAVTYEPPAETYERPEEAYERPAASYEPPAPSYEPACGRAMSRPPPAMSRQRSPMSCPPIRRLRTRLSPRHTRLPPTTTAATARRLPRPSPRTRRMARMSRRWCASSRPTMASTSRRSPAPASAAGFASRTSWMRPHSSAAR